MSAPLLWGPNNTSNGLQNQLIMANGSLINSNGPVNLITNGTFENGLNSMQAFTVTGYSAGTVPTGALTLGSGASIGLSLQTTGALTGVTSLQLTTATTFTAGQGVASAALTIDKSTQSKMCTIGFDYSATAGSANMNFSGTSSNTFHVYFYDATNSVYIQPSNVYGMAASAGKYFGQFQMPYNCVSGYLLILVGNANTTGTTTLLFDNFFVGITAFGGYGRAGTDWKTYTPTFNGFGTVSTYNALYCQDGGDLLLDITFTAGTPTAGAAFVTFPAGLTSSSSLVGTSVAGEYIVNGNTAQTFYVLKTPGTNYVNFGSQSSGSNALTQLTGSGASGTGWLISFTARIPIQGWSSQSQIVSQYDGRTVAAQVNKIGADLAVSLGSPIVFPSVISDSHGAYNAATGQYTCPVSGVYTVQMCSYTTNTAFNTGIFKNGAYALGLTQVTGSVITTACTDIKCNAGDILTIVPDGNSSLGYLANKYQPFASFSLKSGAQQILAGQAITARYHASSTALSGALATVVWTTKDVDTTGGMASGVWTAPSSGYVEVNTMLAIAGTFALNSTVDIQLQKNAAVYSEELVYAGGAVTSVPVGISDIVPVNAGDTIQIQVSSSATGPSIVASNSKNYISLKMI